VDVSPEDDRFKLWNGFENCGVFTIEEGEMDQETILRNLRVLFDADWPWQLRSMDEFSYLVRFPPGQRVDRIVINKISYFYLEKGTVMASLKVWNGNIEPVSSLTEVWVQVRGVPPKWCDWVTFRQVASTIGKLVEVDWQSLFASFFAMVRVKVKCRNPVKIPQKRVMEMQDELFVISFKTEGFEQLSEKSGKDEDDGGDGGDGDTDLDEDDLLSDEEKKKEGGTTSPKNDKASDSSNHGKEVDEPRDKQSKQSMFSGSKTVRDLSQLFAMEMLDNDVNREGMESSCISLLKAMEIADTEEAWLEEGGETVEPEEESLNLPAEWLYGYADNRDQSDQSLMNQMSTEGKADGSDIPHRDIVLGAVDQGRDGVMAKSKPRKRGWGPVQLERKSKRVPLDGMNMLEKAQALKKKNNLEVEKGKKVSTQISSYSLLDIAASLDLDVPVEDLSKQNVVDQVLDLETERNNTFKAACSKVDCPVKVYSKGLMTSDGSQQRYDQDHVGCSRSVGFGNIFVDSRTVGSSCHSSSGKNDRSLDPTTPGGQFYEDKDLNILEAQIEKAWSKVVHRKKSKKNK